MESDRNPDDIWYALANTEVLLAPQHSLATFGDTVIHYHLLTEKMDAVNEIRVREGRVHAERPQVLTPAYFERLMLDGFGEEARDYVDWLRAHVQDLAFLKYGFRFRKEETRETTIHESLETAAARVKTTVEGLNDPLAAVIKGIDDAWEVCLLKFVSDTIRRSVPLNVNELKKRKLLHGGERGLPGAVREEIDRDFHDAGTDAARMRELGAKLRSYGIFEDYEDRFYELVRRCGR